MSPQPVPPSGSSRPHHVGREADVDDVEGHTFHATEQPDKDTEGRVLTSAVSRHQVDDEDDVEGHGLGLNIALTGAIVLGSVAAGASAHVASTVLAPGASSTSAAIPAPTSSPSPGEADSSAAADIAADTDLSSSDQVGGRIESGVYIVPLRITSVDVELA